MTLAFCQAMALGDALVSGDLRSYAVAHRNIGRLPNLLGSVMLLMDRNRGFRRRALGALSGNPGVFERLLAIHLGQISPLDFGLLGAANLGWQLLTAH